jgi:PAS domain S-box-containing protein
MDIDLGSGIDGTQAAETILKTKDIPVLFLSNHIESEIVDRTEKITSYGYVVKNSGDTVLLASIRMAFRLHDAHRELRIREEELKKSQKILSLVFDNTPNAITITDIETNIIIEANKGVEWTGWTREEIIGKSPVVLENWVQLDKGNKIRDILRETGKLSNYRVAFYKKDGTIAHAIMNSVLIQMDDRPYFLTISNDVTRLSVSETLLLHTKDEMKATNEELNATVEELEATNEELQTTITELEETKKYLVRRKDGTTFPALIQSTIIFRNGQPAGIRGLLVDITKRKQIEEELKMFQYTIDQSSETVLWLSRDAGFEYVNEEACRSLGYTREELLGMKLWDIDPVLSRERWDSDLERFRAGRQGGSVIFESMHLRKDGTRYPVEVRAQFLWFGERELHVAVVRDITERKRAEEALGIVLREKETLLHELQHRMKNSLAMITGIIELEAARTDNSCEKTVLNNLKGRIDSLTNLYTLLFQTSMVTEVALDEYIHSIVSSLAATYVDGMNTIQIEPQCDRLTVSVKNATAWGLIANELMTNALKYAFPKGGTGIVRISLKIAGGEVSLSISDNGAGPPPDFNIEHPAGFGMLLVKMLTQQLGGALFFVRGTENVFTVRAPA